MRELRHHCVVAKKYRAMSKKPTERITEALRLMDKEGFSAYTVAKKLELAESSVYSAFQRRKLRWVEAKAEGKCIHCGAPVDANGKYTDRPVV